MKKSTILICVIMLSFPFIFYAQDIPSDQKTKLTALYLNIGGGTSNGSLTGIGLNFILSNNWGASMSFNELYRKSKELPSDYNSGHFFGLRASTPKDKIESYSIRILKEFPSNSKSIRFGIEGGLSFVKQTVVHFTKQRATNLLLIQASNYNVSYSAKNTVGASFRAKLEFPLARWIGLELAAISNINKLQSYVGAEVHMTIGFVR